MIIKIFWFILALILMIPPLVHKDLYLVINNDTAEHLKVFQSIKSGNPSFLYLGQKIVGYSLVWLEKVIRIDIPTLFMWFNYICLYLSGVCVGVLVQAVSDSKLGGLLSAYMIIFGISPTLHLFYSGTIFNIIEILILLPITLLVTFTIIKSKNLWWLLLLIPLSIIVYKFHPSLSYSIFSVNEQLPYESAINPITVVRQMLGAAVVGLLLLTSVTIYKIKPIVYSGTKIIIVSLTILMAGMFGLSFIGITNYSSRVVMNGCLLLGIIICILVGIAINGNKSKLITYSISGFVVISVIPNLIHWLSFPIIRSVS